MTTRRIIEAVVNRISDDKAGITGVYNCTTYAEEKRQALDKWADHILTIATKT